MTKSRQAETPQNWQPGYGTLYITRVAFALSPNVFYDIQSHITKVRKSPQSVSWLFLKQKSATYKERDRDSQLVVRLLQALPHLGRRWRARVHDRHEAAVDDLGNDGDRPHRQLAGAAKEGVGKHGHEARVEAVHRGQPRQLGVREALQCEMGSGIGAPPKA